MHVLTGDVNMRCRELIIKICDAEDVRILKSVASEDYVHMYIEYALPKSLSELVKQLKDRISRLLQQGFPTLHKRYRGQHFWAIASRMRGASARSQLIWWRRNRVSPQSLRQRF